MTDNILDDFLDLDWNDYIAEDWEEYECMTEEAAIKENDELFG